jgi:hypothetical protein
MKRFMFAVVAAAFAVSIADAKVFEVLKINKGEVADQCSNATINLSDKNALKKGGVSWEIEVSAPDNFIAECPPKRGIWAGYDTMVIEYFNPNKDPISCGMVFKPTTPCEYNDRLDTTIIMRPGKGVAEIDLTGSCSNGGKPMDYSKRMAIWAMGIGLKKGEKLYITSFRLETADEVEKRDKQASK